ncbi:MAG: HEAT repeat domain-containing protein [Planctomycetota bacterium]
MAACAMELLAFILLAGVPLPGDPSTADELAEILARPSSEPAERYFALYGLLHRDDERALEHLVRIAKGPFPAALRVQVLEGLRLKTRPEAAPALIELLGNAIPEVAAAAARALEACQDPVSCDAMRDALLDPSRPPAVRRSLAEAFGRIGEFRVLDPLVRALRDPDEGVQTAARAALEAITRESFPDDPAGTWARWLDHHRGLTREAWLSEQLRVVRHRLAASEVELRTLREERSRLARERLGAAASAKNWGIVIETLRQDVSSEVRAAAAQALAVDGTPAEARLSLRRAFREDPDIRVRAEAMRAIAANADEQALSLVSEFLDAPESREASQEPVAVAVIDAAARLLARIPPETRPKESIARLRARLDAQSPRVWIAALKALADLKDPAAASSAAARLGHADREVRLYAAQILDSPDGARFADAVARRLADEPDPRVRENLLRGLAGNGGPAHLQVVLDRLEEKDERVREEAMKAALALAGRSILEPAFVEDVASRLEKSGHEAAALEWLSRYVHRPGGIPLDAPPDSIAAIQERAGALAVKRSDWPKAILLCQEILRRKPSDRTARLAFFNAVVSGQEESKALEALAGWLADPAFEVPPNTGSACAAAARKGKIDAARGVLAALRGRPEALTSLLADMKAALGAVPLSAELREMIAEFERPIPSPAPSPEAP